MIEIAENIVLYDLSGSDLLSGGVVRNAGLVLKMVSQEVIVIIDLLFDSAFETQSEDVFCGLILLRDCSDVFAWRGWLHAFFAFVCAFVTLCATHFRCIL